MSFTELFESGKHRRNLSHFAAMASIASVHGGIEEKEETLLKRLARKLDVTEHEYTEILKNPSKYPIHPLHSADERLETMLDFFKIIFSDHQIDEEELSLVEKYAIGLGYTEELAGKLIKRSIQIFSGGLDLEDYRYLLNKK
ncbi:MAG: TerB family tellurite resistance protein [Flavobacteriaceae bacterium]